MENSPNSQNRNALNTDVKRKNSKLYDKFLSLDLFGDNFELKVDGEGD